LTPTPTDLKLSVSEDKTMDRKVEATQEQLDMLICLHAKYIRRLIASEVFQGAGICEAAEKAKAEFNALFGELTGLSP
jgi:hypothetical protein